MLVALVEEAMAQLAGQSAALLRSSRSLPDEPPPSHRPAFEWWCERKFLRGFALSRTGEMDAAEAVWTQLLAVAGPFEERVRTRLRIETGVRELNQGNFLRSIPTLQGALLQPTSLDVYTRTRAWGCLALAQIHVGDFSHATQSLAQERAYLRRLGLWEDAHGMRAGWRRIQVTLALKRDRFEEAEAHLSDGFRDAVGSVTAHAYLLQLRARLHLARRQWTEAAQTLRELDQWQEKHAIPEASLDPSEERLAWALGERSFGALHAGLERSRARAVARGDRFAEFRVAALAARWLAKQGKRKAALEQLEALVKEAMANAFLPDAVELHFHAAGLAAQQGDRVAFRTHALRGERLAHSLGLARRQAYFRTLIELQRPGHSASAAFVAFLEGAANRSRELEHALSEYRVLESLALQVHDGLRSFLMEERDFRERLFQEDGVFWFRDEGALITREGGRIAVRRFEPQSQSRALFALAMDRPEGFRLEDVHRLRSPAEFHPFRHTSAARMLVSRLRAELAGTGLALEYARDDQAYALRSRFPPLTIQVRSAAARRVRRSGRERLERVLDPIRQAGFLSTQDLCARFGVKRQTLHPILQELVRQRRIVLERRGPISGYRIAR